MNLLSKYSENIAGIISLSGSLILIFLGDIKSIIAAGMFTIAELILTRFGHKTYGYSFSALCFVVGNLFLIYSASLIGDTGIQISLWGMSFAWSLGFLRYFIYRFGISRKSQKIIEISNSIPAVTGSLNIFFKIPGIVFAIQSENYIVAIAISAWMIADVFAGRLQEKMGLLVAFIKNKQPPASG